MPVQEELDPVTLHNLALMHMDADPTGGFRKFNFLLQSPPFPPETFGELLPSASTAPLSLDTARASVHSFLPAPPVMPAGNLLLLYVKYGCHDLAAGAAAERAPAGVTLPFRVQHSARVLSPPPCTRPPNHPPLQM
jgi:hypothetical protein